MALVCDLHGARNCPTLPSRRPCRVEHGRGEGDAEHAVSLPKVGGKRSADIRAPAAVWNARPSRLRSADEGG